MFHRQNNRCCSVHIASVNHGGCWCKDTSNRAVTRLKPCQTDSVSGPEPTIDGKERRERECCALPEDQSAVLSKHRTPGGDPSEPNNSVTKSLSNTWRHTQTFRLLGNNHLIYFLFCFQARSQKSPQKTSSFRRTGTPLKMMSY